MAKKKVDIPQDKLDAYDRLIASNPDIERKGVTNPYTSVNGHMFSHLSKQGTMGLRLPKEEREAFLEKYDTMLYESGEWRVASGEFGGRGQARMNADFFSRLFDYLTIRLLDFSTAELSTMFTRPE